MRIDKKMVAVVLIGFCLAGLWGYLYAKTVTGSTTIQPVPQPGGAVAEVLESYGGFGLDDCLAASPFTPVQWSCDAYGECHCLGVGAATTYVSRCATIVFKALDGGTCTQYCCRDATGQSCAPMRCSGY